MVSRRGRGWEPACLSPLPTLLPGKAEVPDLGKRGLAGEGQANWAAYDTPPTYDHLPSSVCPPRLEPGRSLSAQHPSCGTSTLPDGSWDRNTGF